MFLRLTFFLCLSVYLFLISNANATTGAQANENAATEPASAAATGNQPKKITNAATAGKASASAPKPGGKAGTADAAVKAATPASKAGKKSALKDAKETAGDSAAKAEEAVAGDAKKAAPSDGKDTVKAAAAGNSAAKDTAKATDEPLGKDIKHAGAVKSPYGTTPANKSEKSAKGNKQLEGQNKNKDQKPQEPPKWWQKFISIFTGGNKNGVNSKGQKTNETKSLSKTSANATASKSNNKQDKPKGLHKKNSAEKKAEH